MEIIDEDKNNYNYNTNIYKYDYKIILNGKEKRDINMFKMWRME